MANGHRTYEWLGNRVREVGRKKPASIGVQNGLLLFTLSSLGLVFAGGALSAIFFTLHAIVIR